MPLDFPSSPTNGQVYGNYYYNSARGAWNALLPAATPNFFTSAQLIDATANSSTSSTTPLIVIGSSGQSADLQQWKDSAGTILSDISSQGALMAQYIEVRNIVGSGLVNGESQFKVVSPDGTKDIRFWNRNDAAGMYYYNSSGGSAGVLRIAHSTTPRLVTQLIQDFTSSNSADFGARVNIDTTAAANIGLVVRGAASQTADLQQWQSSTGAVLSSVSADGSFQLGTPLSVVNGGTGAATVTEAQTNLKMPLSQNYVINGGFDIWQRATSSTAAGYGSADRWYSNQQGTVTKSQQTTGTPVGSRYHMRVAYGAASSLGYQYQAFESGTVAWIKGKQVTLSALFRRNASFTAGLTLALQKSTTADVVSTGTWTTISSVTVPNASLPTGTGPADWYRAEVTMTIPDDSTVSGLRVTVQETAVQTTGAYYELSQVQLEEGPVFTGFRRAAITLQGELAECQRFYQIGRMVGRDYGVVQTIDSGAQSNYSYQVQPRATPTLTNISLSLQGGGYDSFYEFNSIYGTGYVYRKGGSSGNGNNYFDLTFSASAELP